MENQIIKPNLHYKVLNTMFKGLHGTDMQAPIAIFEKALCLSAGNLSVQTVFVGPTCNFFYLK